MFYFNAGNMEFNTLTEKRRWKKMNILQILRFEKGLKAKFTKPWEGVGFGGKNLGKNS